MRVWVMAAVAALGACEKKEAPTAAAAAAAAGQTAAEPVPGVELPDVGRQGFDAPAGAPDLVVSPGGIQVGGKPVAATALRDTLVALRRAPGAPERLVLAVDRRVPYRTLVQVLEAARQPDVGVRRFAILARDGAHLVAAPLELPDAAALSAARPAEKADTVLTGGNVIDEVRHRHMNDLRRCFNKLLERNPHGGGRYQLTFSVGPDGAVSGAHVSPDDPCITRAMAAWRLPAPVDAVGAPTTARFAMPIVLHDQSAGESPGPQPPPEGAPPPAAASAAPAPPIGLLVTLHGDELVLASVSGLEGTAEAPALRAATTATAVLSAALAAVIARRWPSGGRTAADRVIILMPEPTTTMDVVAHLIGALRASTAGDELFPDVRLAAGPG